MTPRVAFLGVGAMGWPMAAVLHKQGLLTAVFDPSTARTRELAASGVACARTPADAARAADVVVVMVATAPQAQEALFGRDGAVATLAPGSTVVVTSTIGVTAMSALATQLGEAGLRVVDAPVSGGVSRARSGSLLVMVGADDEAFGLVADVLDAVGGRVAHVGPSPGDGQRLKLVNQLLCGVHIAAAAEALAFADGLGLDVAAVWDVVRSGAAGSFMLDDRGARMAHGSFEPVNSAVGIFTKDLDLVNAAAAEHELPVRLSEAARAMFDAAALDGLATHDDSELYLHLTSAVHARDAHRSDVA